MLRFRSSKLVIKPFTHCHTRYHRIASSSFSSGSHNTKPGPRKSRILDLVDSVNRERHQQKQQQQSQSHHKSKPKSKKKATNPQTAKKSTIRFLDLTGGQSSSSKTQALNKPKAKQQQQQPKNKVFSFTEALQDIPLPGKVETSDEIQTKYRNVAPAAAVESSKSIYTNSSRLFNLLNSTEGNKPGSSPATKNSLHRTSNTKQQSSRFMKNNGSSRTSSRKAPPPPPSSSSPATPLVVDIPATSIVASELASRMKVKFKKLVSAWRSLGENERLVESTDLTPDLAELLVLELEMEPLLLPPEFVDLVPTTSPSELSELASAHWTTRPPIVSIMGHVDHGKTSLLDYLRRTAVVEREAGGITQSIGAFSVSVSSSDDDQTRPDDDDDATTRPSDMITFLDTPGHAAFHQMRKQGSKATDIVVVVIAADTVVSKKKLLRPQTLEVLSLCRETNVPMIIAVTKIDQCQSREEAEEVLQVLAQTLLLADVVVETLGGSIPLIGISSKTGAGVHDELIPAITLQSEMMELRSSPSGRGEAAILETGSSRGTGFHIDAIMKFGSLRRGDVVVCGTEYGKVRLLSDERGQPLEEQHVTASMPVRVFGLSSAAGAAAAAADYLYQVESEEAAKVLVKHRKEVEHWHELRRVEQQEIRENVMRMGKSPSPSSSNDHHQKNTPRPRMSFRERIRMKIAQRQALEVAQSQATKDSTSLALVQGGGGGGTARSSTTTSSNNNNIRLLPIILKTDTRGVSEAIQDLIATTLPQDEAQIKVIASGLGPATSSDVDLALDTGAQVICFNVKVPNRLDREARAKGLEIRPAYRVIYSLLEDLKIHLAAHLPPLVREEVVGVATVLASIPISTSGRRTTNVAGCRVTSGTLRSTSGAGASGSSSSSPKFRLRRGATLLLDSGTCRELRHFREKVTTVASGLECGVLFDEFDDVEVGDVIECYVTETRQPVL